MSDEITAQSNRNLKLFLCGDVMLGRGVDQILPHPVSPELYESYMRSALGYVTLAEAAFGPIPREVGWAYIWGNVLPELLSNDLDARIINLETAVTSAGTPWLGKSIHYRVHPDNLPVLQTARIDCCELANNHVLDWGIVGLEDTLQALASAGLSVAGAGRDREQAAAPAVIETQGRSRVLVFAYGMASSGVIAGWQAGEGACGVNVLDDLGGDAAASVADTIARYRHPGDLVIVALHWGPNWQFEITAEERQFVHRLIDQAAVDVVHGHSSHHIKGIEVYREKLILYGCGDFLNDYEGIGGHEAYRGDLGLMYLPTLDASDGRLLALELLPTRIRGLQVNKAVGDDVRWIFEALNELGRPLGTKVISSKRNRLRLCW